MSQAPRASVAAMLREAPVDAGGDLEVQRPLFEEFVRQQPPLGRAGAFLWAHLAPGSPGSGDDRSPDSSGDSSHRQGRDREEERD